MKRFLLLLPLLSLVGWPVALAQADAPPAVSAATSTSGPVAPPSVQGAGVSRYTLANGMTLLVKPDRRAPTAVHMLWVRVGSMDEVDGTSGVAHVLEHMMFKGTPSVPEGEYSRRVAALGGRDNAFTSRDVTAYHQQVPVGALEQVMALEADRFARNQWSDDAFLRELAVVKEERRQRVEESPQSRLFEAFMATSWLAHPYRRPIIGWMSDLKAMTADDVRDFWRRWYVPANAAVVVVGDVDPEQVRQMAERHYGAIPARAVPARKPQLEPAQQGPRRLEYRGRTQQPLLLVGARGPSLRDPDASDPESQDALALLLLAGVLDGHSAARLERALVQGRPVGPSPAGATPPQRLADQVGASFGLMGRGPQQFLLTGVPANGVTPATLEVALLDEVRRIAREGVPAVELQRVMNQWRASEVYKLDSMFAQARELGSHWSLDWPTDASQRLMAALQRITPAQVQSVAQRYFDEAGLTVGLLLPENRP